MLARRGLYSTHPNPRVGCVLVKDRPIGEGWHRLAGGPHAEVLALQAAGTEASGATCYVTLEPCCHHGRTPPCTDRIVAAGIKRVVAAMADPNPRVEGGGLRQLAAAGIAVEVGLMQAQAMGLNRGFCSRMRRNRPYVTAKTGASLDGRAALASGESRWITGDAARRDVQKLRAASSAVMTGIGTVLSDDPSLNVRLPDLGNEGRQPARIVFDSRLRIPLRARVLSLPGPVYIITSGGDTPKADALRSRGAVVIEVPAKAGRVDLPAALERLAECEINEVLLEAGPTLTGAMLQAGLIDEMVVYMAPKLLGTEARGFCHVPGLARLADAKAMRMTDVRRIGADLKVCLAVEN